MIVIALVVDRPTGLDEGSAAINYEGAEARLLEGFWLQIAAGAVLIACGLLLPRYVGLKDSPPGEHAQTPARRAASAPAGRRRQGQGGSPASGRGVEEPST